VELFLSLLGLPFERIEIDLATKGHKTPAFLAMNAFGQVPVIQDGDVTLADSNAILVYLNARYAPMQTSGCRAIRWPLRPCSAGCRWPQGRWLMAPLRRGSSSCSNAPKAWKRLNVPTHCLR
jgi:glutathione S-transferase